MPKKKKVTDVLSDNMIVKNETIEKEPINHESTLRNSILQNVNQKYHEFVKCMQVLPFNPQSYIDGIKQMDFGMLWIKECIMYAPIQLPMNNAKSNPT